MAENHPARLQKLKELGFRLEYLREIDSTNQDAMRRAANGEPLGLVLVADHQTQGRGRLGRSWQAPPLSSLLASVLVKPEIAPVSLGLVPIVSGLALAQAIEAAAHFQPGLVWPNDLFGAKGKIAGILVESIFEKSDLKFIVIGSGVNLAQKKEDFPAEIRARASSLWEETGRMITREDLLFAYLEKLSAGLGILERGGDRELVENYSGYDIIAGKEIKLLKGGEELGGTALGIDSRGRLKVMIGGQELTFAAGEISMIRGRNDAAGN